MMLIKKGTKKFVQKLHPCGELGALACFVNLLWCSHGKAMKDCALVFFVGTHLCLDGDGHGDGLRSLECVCSRTSSAGSD
jgi:hypothetical protein